MKAAVLREVGKPLAIEEVQINGAFEELKRGEIARSVIQFDA